MPEVAANLVTAFCVFYIVRTDVNDAAIIVQLEMVSGLLVREPHDVIAVFFHRRLVVLRQNNRRAEK